MDISYIYAAVVLASIAAAILSLTYFRKERGSRDIAYLLLFIAALVVAAFIGTAYIINKARC